MVNETQNNADLSELVCKLQAIRKGESCAIDLSKYARCPVVQAKYDAQDQYFGREKDESFRFHSFDENTPVLRYENGGITLSGRSFGKDIVKSFSVGANTEISLLRNETWGSIVFISPVRNGHMELFFPLKL